MKRPAFQFYPADWRKDPALSICSLAARGLWIEMMCIAHESDEYGVLVVAGNPMTAQHIARSVGESLAVVKRLLAELEEAGVFSRDERGCIYSRRMCKDERSREKRAAGGEAGAEFGHLGAEHGKKGGRPRKETGDKKPPFDPPLEPPPSSSSSSSIKPPDPPSPVGFGEFWSAYPRKVGKGEAEKAWKVTKGVELKTILQAIERARATEQWRKDGGQFIPHPATWLRQKRWEDEPEATPRTAGNVCELMRGAV